MINVIFGLVTGFLFGYILSRTGITRYSRVMGMLLLKDFKILKFMLTAVVSSMLLFYLFGDLGMLKVIPKTLDWGKVAGGLIFGIGMGILGYCPGTMAARIGEGKKDSILALFGMSFGIFLYASTIKPLKQFLLTGEINGDLSLLSGLNHWFFIIPAALLFSFIIYIINKKVSDAKNIF